MLTDLSFLKFNVCLVTLSNAHPIRPVPRPLVRYKIICSNAKCVGSKTRKIFESSLFPCRPKGGLGVQKLHRPRGSSIDILFLRYIVNSLLTKMFHQREKWVQKVQNPINAVFEWPQGQFFWLKWKPLASIVSKWCRNLRTCFFLRMSSPLYHYLGTNLKWAMLYNTTILVVLYCRVPMIMKFPENHFSSKTEFWIFILCRLVR